MIPGEDSAGTAGNLLRDLIDFVSGGENCSLVLIGDKAQLPPVGSLLSPALVPRELRDWYDRSVSGAELKQVVRQSGLSGILDNATRLRGNLESSSFRIELKEANDVHRIHGGELAELLEDLLTGDSAEESILVCRSNKRANAFNNQIRQRIFFREEELEAGDRIMIVRNNYLWLGEQEKGFIANGDMAEVVRVANYESHFGFRFANVTIRLIDLDTVPELEVKVLVDCLQTESPALSSIDSERLFAGVELDYGHIKSKGQRYLAMKKDPYLNALQVKYAWAVTGHKAQGGQWDHVIVDQGFLTQDMLDESLMRWFYTSITRAKKTLHLLNFHDDFFNEDE
jgi:exodeoxyribonuclease-5